MVDSTLAFDILARDHASNAFDKVARSADKTGAALKKTGKISDDVAKSSANLTKAHNAESDALDKVQLAEAKLADVRGNAKSKTSQIVAAENALSKARRDAAVASNTAQKAAKDLGTALDNEGKKAGKGLGSSLKKWFTGDGKNVFKQIGEDGGTVFGSGLLGALKTPVLGPAIIAGIGGAVAIAAPAVGAIAGAGIVAGFGAGLAGLGIVFAAKSKVVQDKWAATLKQMGADLRLMSAPFDSTLIAIANTFQRTFNSFNPALTAAFKKMAVPIENFADQAGRAFEKLIPAIAPITDAFNAVLKSLGPALQDAVGSLASGLTKLAASVSKNPTGLADLTRGAGDLSKQLLGMIATLNDADAAMKKLTGASGVTILFKSIQGLAAATVGPILLLAKGVTALGDSLNALQHGTNASGQSMSDAANKTVALAMGLKTAGDGAVHASTGLNANAAAATRSAHETHAANVAANLLAGAFDRQSAATQRSIDLLNRQSSVLLALSGSQIAYQQAVDDATAAVKENGKTHDITTAKGRANKTALDQVAASAIAQRDAMLKANDGNVKAARSAESSRGSFVKLAVQMGYSQAEAQKMARDLIKIPNVTREAKLKANKADLDSKLAAAKKQLADPKLTATKRAKLEATIAQLQAAVNAAQAKINGLHGKTVVNTVITKFTSTGVNLQTPSSVGRRASGGPVEKGKPYIVGEHRPELFVPKQDGEIIPKVPQKAKGTAFAGGSGGTTINVYVSGALDSRDAADKIVNQLRKFVRVSAGGDVQAALGR